MRTALLIAYYFPPLQAVGGYRTLRFAKFLPEFGWKPVVLTAAPEATDLHVDPTLLEACPTELLVRRTGGLNPARAYRLSLAALRRWTGRASPAEPESRSNGAKSTLADAPPHEKRWRTRLFETLCCTPDPQVWWAPVAVRAGWKLIRAERPDVLYTSGPPHSAHLAGLILHRLTGIPWVADFRDPWAREPWKAGRCRNWRARLEERFERACVRHSAAVVLNTEAACREFQTHYADVPPSRFLAIPNGYDPDLRSIAEQLRTEEEVNRRAGTIRLCHAGSLYGRRSLLPLIDAIGLLTREGMSIELVHYGECEELADVERRIAGLGLHDRVSVHEPVPQREALRQMARSDILVALQPGTALQIPAKVFEMVLFDRPILVLAGEGATADLVESHHLGAVAPCSDPQAIAGAIRSLRDAQNARSPGASLPTAVDEFDGRALTERLAHVFGSVASALPDRAPTEAWRSVEKRPTPAA